MTIDVESAEEFRPCSLEEIPDGDYPGTLGTCVATAAVGGVTYRFALKEAAWGFGFPCVVRVRGGKATVEALPEGGAG